MGLAELLLEFMTTRIGHTITNELVTTLANMISEFEYGKTGAEAAPVPENTVCTKLVCGECASEGCTKN